MIACLLRTWGVWFLAVQLVVEAEVTVENGAYTNLVVSLSPNLPSEDSENIVKLTEDLLQKTSAVLQQTIGVPIGGPVTIVVPDHWDLPDTESIPQVQPDILVDHREGSPFGKGPFAEQYGGCGVPGTHIDVPYSFLTSEETYPKEKLLAREWLKFRYGVFDEHGFPGDSKYPEYYIVPGDEGNVKITECTDPALEYLYQNSNNETCSLGEDGCKVHIGDNAEEVKSSLMYLHEELKNVDEVCGEKHQHNFMSPSKQNILCSEKSIWDVLKESGEFTNLENLSESTALNYKFVKFSKPKVLILFEATSALKNKKEEIIFALRRVMYDLPEGTQLGLRTFIHTEESGEIRALSELGENRNILIQANFEAPADGVCPLCALEKAVDDFSESEPDLIILITASSSKRSNNDDLLDKLKKSHIFLQLITVTNDGVSLGYEDFLKPLTHLNQAHLSEISSETDIVLPLYAYILSRFPFSHTDPATKIVANGVLSTDDGSITIPENSLTETVTIWIYKVLDVNQLKCRNENGNDVNLTYIGEQYISRATYNEDGSVSCKLGYGDPAIAQVTKPKPTDSEYSLSARTWVHDTTPKVGVQQADSQVQMPVIIYSKINYGSYPVHNANVKSVIKDDEEKETTVSLKDDGKGDPDITKGDGIYSGYFFEFTKGSYNVKVDITTDPSQTKAIITGNERCCGTQVEPKKPIQESTINVPAFEKFVSTTVFRAVGSKPENGYPPSRILDLKVTKFEPPSLLELSWTAPGGEVDQGNAASYTLKSFINRTDALENFDSAGQEITITKTPSQSGSEEVLTLQLDGLLDDNMTHYLTLRAEGKTPGQPSNVVTVSVPEAGKPTEPPQPTETPKTSGANSTTIAIVIGVLVGVIVISIFLYLAIYCIGKKKAKAKREGGRKAEEGSAGAVRNGGGMGMNSIPADVILRHHSEVVRAKLDHKDPPIFTEEDATSQKQDVEYSEVKKDPPELPTTAPPKSPKRMTVV